MPDLHRKYESEDDIETIVNFTIEDNVKDVGDKAIVDAGATVNDSGVHTSADQAVDNPEVVAIGEEVTPEAEVASIVSVGEEATEEEMVAAPTSVYSTVVA